MRSKIALLASVIAVMAGAVLFATWPDNRPTAPQATALMALRQVIVISDRASARTPAVRARLCGLSSNCANGKDGVDVVMLERGVTPQHPVRAVVETDENCTPDAYGISHCTNQLRLANGTRLTVRHDHNMRLYPCLRPGEVVAVESESAA